MLNLDRLAEWLQKETEWQETPRVLDHADYLHMIIDALERLFVDTTRSSQYSEDFYQEVESSEGVYLGYNADFPLDEKKYIQICAKINFFTKVQTDVNNIIGYSTNALTVTHANKPYENLQNTLDDLEKQRRIIYYKMNRYALGTI